MKFTKIQVGSFLVILFHVVGFAGFLIPQLEQLFRLLVPWHLLLMLALMLITQRERGRGFFVFLFLIYVAGFIVETAGTNTGLIFGDYSYGATLGIKVFETPLMIGVNWILVIYSGGALLWQLGIKDAFKGAIAGAAMVTFLDYLIEPVAIHFDYWSWHGEPVPIQNYIGWFVFSALLFLLFYKLPFRKANIAAAVLFITQLLFFLALNIFALR